MKAFNLTKQLIISILFILLGYDLIAQENPTPPSFQFEIFDMPGGELGNHCQSIAQDPIGFMWFGTSFGLHRWDGYQFKTYRHDPFDSTTISLSYVEEVYVANDSTLWIGTWGGGLNHFDPKTETFTRYMHDPKDENSLSNNYVVEIDEDHNGNLWISTQSGVNRMELETKTIKRFLPNPNDPNSLSYEISRTLLIDSEGVVWVGTGFGWDVENTGGLNRYNPKSEDFTQYLHDPNDPESLSDNRVLDIFEDSKGNFWVTTKFDGLNKMDRKTGKFERYQNNADNKSNLYSPWVRDYYDYQTKFIFEDKKNKLWIGAWRGGLKYYDPETDFAIHFYQKDKKENTIPDDYLWEIFQSKDGTLWASTTGPNAKIFKIIENDYLFNFQNTMVDAKISAIYENSGYNDLWLAGNGIGLLRINSSAGDTLQYLNDPQNPQKFNAGAPPPFLDDSSYLFEDIYLIKKDLGSNLWLAKGKDSWDHSLLRFNYINGEVDVYLQDPNNDYHQCKGIVRDISVDDEGRVWVTTSNAELLLFDEEKNDFKSYFFGKDEGKSINGKKRSSHSMMAFNDGENIYIAHNYEFSSSKKIYLEIFNTVNKVFMTEAFELDQFATDSEAGLVNGIQLGKSSEEWSIWITTSSSLYKFETGTREFSVLSAESFNTPVFRGIVMDEKGLVWILGNGLISYDPDHETSFIYKNTPGLHHLSSGSAIHKGETGKIYVGGKDGYFAFFPDKIGRKISTEKPQILITEFKLLDKTLQNKEKNLDFNSVWEQEEISLTYDQNVFSFRFAALDFLDPESNRHEFMLENYDPDWRITDGDPKISYIKVEPGEYTFKVRAANHSGVWGDEKSIKVTIAPPWWNTLWAKIAFYASLVFLIFGFYRFQLNRRLQASEANRLRELDAVKTQLYTNITHEFRTPLTVIAGMVKQIRENPKEWFNEGLNMISRNNDRLLNLVNQMLDLSKLESGKMTMNLVQSDVVNYIKYLVEAFDSYAESEKIQLHFYSEVEELTMDYDAEKLQQVVTNLLSNAVKFTPEGGNVYVSVREEKNNEIGKSTISIKVRDTGIGISEEQIEHIFDRFYQVDDSMTRQKDGSGIGLALTYELVKLMDGEIKVKSKQGSGTEFVVELPVRNEAIQTNPLDIEKNPVIENIISKASPVYKKYESVKSGPVATSIPTSKPQILLIEDNPDVVAYVASFLDNDYQIKVGKDGQEGIELALKNIPDLVISDVMMPYKDGFEVCETLKNDERTSHIPIIMLTAKADIQSKLEGLEHGADAYLPKPFHKEELLLRIKKLLELREKLQQHYLSLAGFNGTPKPKEIPQVKKIEDYFVIKARKAVEANLSDFDFNVEALCKELMLSHSQVHRKLSALTGFSANKFIRYVRLNRAKELLQDPDLSVLSVAMDTGFSDPNYFGRVFRKEFGKTPTQWREEMAFEK